MPIAKLFVNLKVEFWEAFRRARKIIKAFMVS